jgi:DNA-binding response OmpR family regulator
MAKILVIDDEQNLRRLAQVNLEANKYEVITATSGIEGLKAAEQEHPDLVLLDVRMPDMSGWDVLMALKMSRKLKKIPVVIMSASPPYKDEQKLRNLRTSGWLLKPFSVEELLQEVKRRLESQGDEKSIADEE